MADDFLQPDTPEYTVSTLRRIAIIEDDPELAELFRDAFKDLDFPCLQCNHHLSSIVLKYKGEARMPSTTNIGTRMARAS